MNLKTLTQQALEAGGFDGLYNVDGACACKADDLFPCGLPCEGCHAGYLSECDGTCDTGECDFHIIPHQYRKKQKAEMLVAKIKIEGKCAQLVEALEVIAHWDNAIDARWEDCGYLAQETLALYREGE